MDLESLKTKVSELGGNQFESLSERTVDHILNRELKRNSEDAYYTDEVLKGIVEDLKEMDGNLHFEVGKKNTEYKTRFEEDWKKTHPDPKKDGDGDDKNKSEYQKLLDKLNDMEEKFQKADDERKQKDAVQARADILKSVKEGLEKRFKDAGREVNEYILKQTLRDVEIPEKDADVKTLVKTTEKAYDAALKEAGLDDTAFPRFNVPRGKGAAKSRLDTFFANKSKNEGWKK